MAGFNILTSGVFGNLNATGDPVSAAQAAFSNALSSDVGSLPADTLTKLNVAGLVPNIGDLSGSGTSGGITTPSSSSDSTSTVSAAATNSTFTDTRIRISAIAGREADVYGAQGTDNILSPLYNTGGMMFPYTPSIQISGETEWSASETTHSNFDVLSYKKTSSANIGLTGRFTVQNQREGEYALAVIHFLRTVGKMYYGDQDSAQSDAANKSTTNSKAGLPPPVLRLNGYGTYMFNNLKCVLKSYAFTFEETMDMIPISTASGTVCLPPMFNITVGIALQQNPTVLRSQFYLDKFRTGELMRSGGWF